MIYNQAKIDGVSELSAEHAVLVTFIRLAINRLSNPKRVVVSPLGIALILSGNNALSQFEEYQNQNSVGFIDTVKVVVDPTIERYLIIVEDKDGSFETIELKNTRI